MKAALMDAFEQPLVVREVPEPTPAEDGVVIKVEANGLCRSDWHAWMGHDPGITEFPHVPGHEMAGVIAAVGSRVQTVGIGDRVTVPFCLG